MRTVRRTDLWLPFLGAILLSGCGAGTRTPEPSPRVLMSLVEAQVALGPRVPGTAGHQRGLEWLRAQLRKSGARLSEQSFLDTVPGLPGPVTLTNLVASFGPAGGPRTLYCAHWDCRPWSDRDPDSTRWSSPLPGANDGASGVAVLVHLAAAFGKRAPATGVDLVFLDGEDLGNASHPEGFFRGSRHFSRDLPARYRYGILLDMVGGKGASFRREPNSMMSAGDVVDLVWHRAAQLKLPSFSDEIGESVLDDHIPLNQAGVPTADVIDLRYPQWHTTADLPDAMDPAGMSDCFRLLASLAYRP